jgi:glyoxylase-like metal-dependent hydrolase (beta-lactamase superfamily II)
MIALRSRLKTSILISAVGLMIMPATDLRAQEAKRSIEQVKGDVYRFQNDFHFAMFVITDDGIVVTDPINADAVNWLKAELADRFEQPVTHMVLSHYHADHASGGEAWGDIEVIAHENAKVHIEAGEVQTAIPTETFADQHTFSLGGKDFELTYLGEGHSDDLIAMVVRPENVAFVVDVVSPKSVPWRDFPHTDINGMIEQIKTVEALDFEIMAPGLSVIGTKQDATDVRVYIEEMRDAVKAALAEGQSEAEIIASDIGADYKEWTT